MDTGNSFQFLGQLPTWLQGILLRNGPGMHTIGDSKYNHWFDGMALLHSFTFKNGKLLHIGLKGTQQPTVWCLMLLILFWVGLECWGLCLQGCVMGELLWGNLCTHPSHLTLHRWSIPAGLFTGRCYTVLSSAVPEFSAAVSPGQHKAALGRALQGQENICCLQWISHRYCSAQRLFCCAWTGHCQGGPALPFWDLAAAITAARREIGPPCHFTYLDIWHPTVPPPACRPYRGKTGSYLS